MSVIVALLRCRFRWWVWAVMSQASWLPVEWAWEAYRQALHADRLAYEAGAYKDKHSA